MKMPANVPTSAEFALLVGRVTSLENSRTADEAAFKALAVQLGLDEAAIAKLVAAATPPPIVVPPVILPPYDPQVFWRAGMETGDLSAWAVQNNNTGSALSSAVRAIDEGIPQRTTPWVMKQAVTVNGSATRMGATSIVSLVKSGTPFWVTWWDYYPAVIRFGPADQYAI